MPSPEKDLALEGFTFTATEAEAAAIYLMLKEDGFDASSKGLKAFVLDQAGVGPRADEDDQEGPASGPGGEAPDDLSDKVRRIIEAAGQNPELTGLVIKKGSQFLGSLLRRLS